MVIRAEVFLKVKKNPSTNTHTHREFPAGGSAEPQKPLRADHAHIYFFLFFSVCTAQD